MLCPEEDAEAKEEGWEQILPGERGHGAGEALATQQGFIQAAVGGRWGPGLVAHVCLQGGDWNSLKQLFNYHGGCQESPVHTHAPPPPTLKDSLVFAATSHPGHTSFLRVEKQPGSEEGSLLPKQPWACVTVGVIQPSPSRRLPSFLPAGRCQQAAPV